MGREARRARVAVAVQIVDGHGPPARSVCARRRPIGGRRAIRGCGAPTVSRGRQPIGAGGIEGRCIGAVRVGTGGIARIGVVRVCDGLSVRAAAATFRSSRRRRAGRVCCARRGSESTRVESASGRQQAEQDEGTHQAAIRIARACRQRNVCARRSLAQIPLCLSARRVKFARPVRATRCAWLRLLEDFSRDAQNLDLVGPAADLQ